MLRHWLQKTIQTFNGALQINLKRFPITLFFILSLTCYLCYLVAADQPENKKLYWILGYYLSVGPYFLFPCIYGVRKSKV